MVAAVGGLRVGKPCPAPVIGVCPAPRLVVVGRVGTLA